MLDLEVLPQEGLQTDQWEFVLGMHFSQAVAIVQSQVGVIKSANVVYNDQTPLEHDLILDLPQDGFRLIFDSRCQRLKIIEVYNMKLVKLKYSNTPFNGPGVSPTVEQIDRCFGATRPGSYDKQRGLFALNFRGLIFYFPVDLQYQPHYSHGLGSLRFPGDAAPVLSKMIIYNGQSPSEAPAPPLPEPCFRGQVYTEDCQVIRNSNATRTLGLRLRLVCLTKNIMEPTKNQFEREIRFGEDAQSVVAKLGTPARVFYKSDDKMKIHSREAHKKIHSNKSDYFFNYLTLGLDILFDSRTHEVIKFVLHTNFPGHYDFNSYHRCPFTLEIGRINLPSPPSVPLPSNPKPEAPMSKLSQKSPKPKKNKNGNNNNNNVAPSVNNASDCTTFDDENLNSAKSSRSMHSLGTAGTSVGPMLLLGGSSDKGSKIAVSFDSHWEEISDFACESQDRIERPVVLTRSSSNNPFGSSLCYGVQDMIFEVMSNDHIASVTLYKTPDI